MLTNVLQYITLIIFHLFMIINILSSRSSGTEKGETGDMKRFGSWGSPAEIFPELRAAHNYA